MPDETPQVKDEIEHNESDAEFEEATQSSSEFPWMRIGARALALAGFVVLIHHNPAHPMFPEPSCTII